MYSNKLNRDNSYATLVTESLNWIRFCPDADVTVKKSACLIKAVMQDTNDSRLISDGKTNFREYFDNSNEWQEYLRALFYLYRSRYGTGSFKSSKLPLLNDFGNEFQLRLRDGPRNENRIVFFKRAINRRRVTMVSGLERYMEWVAT